jgi:hypothetical protein
MIDCSREVPSRGFLTSLDGERLDTYETVTSPFLAGYPGQQIKVPGAVVKGFFAGIFCEAHPKAHVLSTLSGAVKNLVGFMHKDSRQAMHNMKIGSSPWGIVGTHNSSSHAKIAQTAYAVTRILGTEIIGYLGDSFSTITAIGPDTGPHTRFQAADRTITFSRQLFWQETATLAVSMIAAQHVMKGDSRHPRLQFNRYFRSGNPLADEIYQGYAQRVLRENPELATFAWRLLGTPAESALATDLRGMLTTHLAGLTIDLQ